MPLCEDQLQRHFSRIWPIHVEGFSALLITLRQHFGGDLDCMLVLAVIGTRTLPHRRLGDGSYEDFNKGTRLHEPDPINIQSIAACTGIPRETVRRKIQWLEAQGWLERNGNGWLFATGKAARDLAPMTEATIRYLTCIGSACIDIHEAEQGLGAEPGA